MKVRHRALALLAVAALIVTALLSIARIMGLHAYVVHTGSMEPNLRPGDLVVDTRPTGHYHRGEILTFRHSSYTTDVVTHRVVSIDASGLITTKGDANRTADVWAIRPGQVKGRVALKLRGLGYVVVFMSHASGVAALACALVTISLLWGLFFPAAPDPAQRHRRPSHRKSPALTVS